MSALEMVQHSLMAEEEIVAAAIPAVDGYSGVYFLVDGNEIVYVGQSTNVYSRISTHVADAYGEKYPGQKKFDRVAVVMCPAAHLTTLEAAYIRKFLPRHNKALTGGSNGRGATLAAERMKRDKLREQEL